MSRHAVLLRRFGLALAIAGVVGGAGVLATAGEPAAGDPVAERRERRELARLNGTAGVQTARFDAWLGSLWHGRRLGFTLAVLGLLAGGACRHLGALMDEDVDA